jgi:hypothetical protein
MVTCSGDFPEAPAAAHSGAQCAPNPAGLKSGTAMFVSIRPRMRELARLFCTPDAELDAIGVARQEISRDGLSR